MATMNAVWIGDSIWTGYASSVVVPDVVASLLTSAGYSVVTSNQAHNGSATKDWTVAGAYYITAKSAINSINATDIFIGLGLNDANQDNQTDGTTYQSRIQSIITDLLTVASIKRIWLICPIYPTPGYNASWTIAGPPRVVEYRTRQASLAASNQKTYAVCPDFYDLFRTNIDYRNSPTEVHPSALGSNYLASRIADAVLAQDLALGTAFAQVKNNARSTLASGRSLGGSSFALTAGTGSRFPSPSATNPMRITAITAATAGTASESLTIFQATGRSGDTLTGLSVIEGSADQSFAAGDIIEMRPTAGTFSDIHGSINTIEGKTITSSGRYSDPSWITSIDAHKVTGGLPLGSANQLLGVSIDGLTQEYKSISAGSGISLSFAAGSMTISSTGGSGTVTSIGLAMPGIFTVSNSPITGAGTLTATLANQSANLIFAGPSTGAAASPGFRALVAGDIPDLSATYSPRAGSSSLTTVGTIASGTWQGTPLGVAYGGTGQTTASAAYNALTPITTLGDLVYGTGANSAGRLAGNTAASRKFLRQLGTGTTSAAPVWDTLVAGDIPDLSATYSPIAGSSSIVTVGTIASGTWQGTAIAPTKGGTGLTALGTANQIPGMNLGASAYEWKSLVQGSNITITHGAGTITIASTGGSVAIGGAVGSGTAGSMLFVDGSGNLGQANSSISWDTTNLALSITSSTANQSPLIVKNSAATGKSRLTIDAGANANSGFFLASGGSNKFEIANVVSGGTNFSFFVYNLQTSTYSFTIYGDNNRVGIGGITSPTGQLHIQSTSTTTPTLVLQAVASQSASAYLLDLRDNLNANVGYIDKSGNIYTGGTIKVTNYSTFGGTYWNYSSASGGCVIQSGAGSYLLSSGTPAIQLGSLGETIIPGTVSTGNWTGLSIQHAFSSSGSQTWSGSVDVAAVRMIPTFGGGSLTLTASNPLTALLIAPTYNLASGSTGRSIPLRINPTYTSVGTGLIPYTVLIQDGGTDRIGIDRYGRIIGAAPAPSVSAGTGAGTSPTISYSGTDQSGVVTVTTGTSPTASADVVTVTFSNAFPSAPKAVILTPANASAAALSGGAQVFADPANFSTTSIKITVGSSGLTGSTTYKWNILIF